MQPPGCIWLVRLSQLVERYALEDHVVRPAREDGIFDVLVEDADRSDAGRLEIILGREAEAYVMALPEAGSVLEWKATINVPGMEGQGIAWDRSVDDGHLWAIVRKNRKVLKVRMPETRN